MTSRTASVRRRITHAATALSLAACAAGVAFATLSTGSAGATPSAPVPLFWSPNGNESLLLPAAQIGSITGTGRLAVTGVSSQFADHSKKVTPTSCVAAYQPAERAAYPDAVNVTTVAVDDGGRSSDPTRLVQQSVVGFPDATTAQKRFDAVSATWEGCSTQPVTVATRSGLPNPWAMGTAPRRDGAVAVVTNIGPGVVCERAMSVRDELVADVMVCALGGGDANGQADAIAAAVGANIAKRTG